MRLSEEQKDIVIANIMAMFLTVIGWYLTGGVITRTLFGGEGLLWYNTLQVLWGKVPIADFNAYDPFRYYWSAGWLLLLGKGLLGLRLSIALVQFIGILFSLLLLRKVKIHWIEIAVIGVAILSWFTPRYKIYDIAVLPVAI